MSASKFFQSNLLSVGAASVLSLATVLLGGLPSKAQSETILNQPNASPENLPVLSMGAANNTVEEVQRFLENQGYYQGQIDGIYGSQTSNAVAQFQADNQLVADGIIGENTWDRMLSLADTPQNSVNQQPNNIPTNNYPDNSIQQQPGYDQQEMMDGQPNYQNDMEGQPNYNTPTNSTPDNSL